MKTRTVCLATELSLALGALRVMRELAAYWSEQPDGIEGSCSELLHDLSASLVVEARIGLLQRVLRDEVDPRELWCEANDGDGTEGFL